MKLITAAKYYLKNGINVIATGTDKRAIFPWKAYQERKLNDEELQEQFTSDRCFGIAVICGGISGKLEVVDVDCKYDLTGTLFPDLMAAIYEVSKELADKLKVIQTKSGGYHIYYRCEVIAGNQKLAQRPATDEESKENPNEKVKVLIETRGESGYVIAPPTEGYKKVTDNEIPVITPEERDLLFEISRSFHQIIEEQPKPYQAKTTTDNYAVSPWEDYNNRGVEDMLNRLQKHGWTIVKNKGDKVIFKRPGKTDSKTSGDYSYKHNLFTVFTTSSEFEPIKGYKPAAVFTVLECGKDFSKGAKELIAMGYGEKKVVYDSKLEREIFQKKQDGATKEDLIKLVKQRKDKTEEEATEIIEQLEKQWGEQLCVFWDVDKNGKLSINRKRFIDFLHFNGGFGLFFYDHNSTIYRLVQLKDGFVQEASAEQMKKFILSYIENLPDTFDGGVTPDELAEIIIINISNFFSESILECLPRIEIDFLKDTAEKAYGLVINGVVCVTKDKVTLDTYGSVGKQIWKTQVIDFHIDVNQHSNDNIEFLQFIEKICSDEPEKIAFAISLVGYLLHKFKDSSRPYAVVFGEETEDEKKGGGTGKGTFSKAFKYMMNTEFIDAKNFRIGKNFAFQRVGLDTKLIVLDDARKNFDFESFYSIITEGITVEKKNKDELYIPFQDSPKILITTNYTISNQGNHAKRRQKVLEFGTFFNPSNTPMDYFGHKLFDDWDKDEWNRFYNLMFFCVQTYLQKGVPDAGKSESNKRKQIKLKYGEDFLDWWVEYSGNGCEKPQFVKDLHEGFLKQNDIPAVDFKKKWFLMGVEEAADLWGWSVKKQRNNQAARQTELFIKKQ